VALAGCWQPSIASRITAFDYPAAYHHPLVAPASKSGFAVVVTVVVAVTRQVGVHCQWQQLRLVMETPPQVACDGGHKRVWCIIILSHKVLIAGRKGVSAPSAFLVFHWQEQGTSAPLRYRAFSAANRRSRQALPPPARQ